MTTNTAATKAGDLLNKAMHVYNLAYREDRRLEDGRVIGGAANGVLAVIELCQRAAGRALATPPQNAEPALAAEGCLCHGCGIRYRGDLNIPDDVWAKISNGDNLLCASCIARRIIEAGIWTAIRGEDVDLNPNMPEPEQSAGRWDGKHWLNGTAGNCNIVTYNGEDVVGVGYIANDNAREQVIADHNARLDAQSADTPSEAPVAWQRRCDGGEWLQCSREQYEHTVRRGNAGVVGDNAEARALYALRQQPARDEVSEAEVEAAADIILAESGETRESVGEYSFSIIKDVQRKTLEAAARVRADHFVDADRKFIADVSPNIILALIARLERAERTWRDREPPHCATCDCEVPSA